MPNPREKRFARLAVDSGAMTVDQLNEVTSYQAGKRAEGDRVDLWDSAVLTSVLDVAAAEKLREAAGDMDVEKIEQYYLDHMLGRGAMGSVWLAHDPEDNKVAIKVLHTSLAGERSFLTRFLREGETSIKLKHKGIVRGLATCQAAGRFCFVMEYVDGENVDDLMKRTGPLPPQRATEIILAVAEALSYAHANGVIHRDIKPANIMLTKSGEVKLADLGVARLMDDELTRLTSTGASMGTPFYMAPEQWTDAKRTDARSDIYSLGATWYRMIVGRVPFMGNSPMEVMRQHVEEPLKWPAAAKANIASAITGTVQRMMSKNPETRIQSMDLLMNIIREKCLGDRSIFEQLGIERGKKKVAAMWELKFTQGDTVKEVRLPEERLADLLRKSRIPRDTLVRVAYEGGEYSPIKDAPELQPYLAHTAPPVMSKGADKRKGKGKSARSDRPKRDTKQRGAPPMRTSLREFVEGYDDRVAEYRRKKRRKKLISALVRAVIVAAVLAALGYAGYKYLPALTGGQDAAPAAEYDE